MNQFILIVFLCSFFAISQGTDQSSFVYAQATHSDVPALVQLMNEQGIHEEGIVVPPVKFRKAYFQSAIEAGHLYVVKDGSAVVAYKKLLLLDDPKQRDSILEDEIRCEGKHVKSIMQGIIRVDGTGVAFEDGSLPQNTGRTTYVYTGGDFTSKKYRGRGVNKALMNMALSAIKVRTREHVIKNKSDGLSMVFGITGPNGASEPGSKHDRTCPIAKSFLLFAQGIAKELDKDDTRTVLDHRRSRAYKPSFDPTSDSFEPLADEYAVSGAGVVLTYPIVSVEEDQ